MVLCDILSFGPAIWLEVIPFGLVRIKRAMIYQKGLLTVDTAGHRAESTTGSVFFYQAYSWFLPIIVSYFL